MVDLKYIVTGTGRCGTLFFANLLTSMGIPCSHEAIFTPYGLSFVNDILNEKRKIRNSEISDFQADNLLQHDHVVADSSYMAAPFLNHFDSEVIHLVRDPIKVIGSFIGTRFNFFPNNEPTFNEALPKNILYENFIFKNLPELSSFSSQLDRACFYYIKWNQMIEKSNKVKLFLRIEDGIENLKKFFNFKGSCYNNPNCNSFKDYSLKWTFSQIKNLELQKELIDISKKYRYYKIY
jgi:hypothetical protein